MLETLGLHHAGPLATVRLEPEMFARAGAGAGDSEGLIDHPRSIAGVDAMALIRRRDDGTHKVSLRSRGEVDVEKIARHHGGGGHRNAAGYALDGAETASTAAVERQVVAEVAAALPAAGAGSAGAATEDGDTAAAAPEVSGDAGAVDESAAAA